MSRRMEAGLMVRETVGEQTYEFYPLGRHIVSAPRYLGGQPTFKYTRVDVASVLELLASGMTIDEIVEDYNRPEISREAIEEARSSSQPRSKSSTMTPIP